jgi:hypothetical protein
MCSGGQEPVVVASPKRSEYAVFWQGQYRPYTYAIYGRRFSARSGSPIGNEKLIAPLPGFLEMRAGYDDQRDEYLLAWHDPTRASGVKTGRASPRLARREGTTASGGSPSGYFGPLLHNSHDSEYLVLQHERGAEAGLRTDFAVRALRFSADGRPLSRYLQRVTPMPAFSLRSGGAYDSRRNRYLLTWVVVGQNAHRVSYRLLSASGRPIGSPRQLASAGSNYVADVAAAYSPRRREFLVTWSTRAPDHIERHGDQIVGRSTLRRRVAGRLLDPTGRPKGPPFPIRVALGPGGTEGADLALSAAGDRYAISWNPRGTGSRLGVLDPDRRRMVSNVLVYKKEQQETTQSSIAFNARAGTALTVWTDGVSRNKGKTIRGRLMRVGD